jgi:hypothetical protein
VKAIVTNTQGIVSLVKNASGRNRSVYEDKFISGVDPKGVHVLGFQMIHNDEEMRTQWMCKMRDIEDPVTIWLDVDFDLLDSVSHEVDTDVN